MTANVTASVNDNTPRIDGRMLLADAGRFYVIAHVYLAASGVVFALDGWWFVGVLFVGMFVLLLALGGMHSVAARDAFDYDAARDELNRMPKAPQSWRG